MPKGLNSSTPWRVLALVVVGMLMFAPLSAASKSGKGGGPTRGTGSETCLVTPNQVPNGSQFSISGSGFKPAQMLDLFVGDGGIVFAQANGDGAFASVVRANYTATGSKVVNVYEMGDRHMTVLASCSFTVY